MHSRLVGVAMNQRAGIGGCQPLARCRRVHICIVGDDVFARLALPAQFAGDDLAFG